MVKIRDLSNKQIIEQLTKYFRFISALDNERQKRLKKGVPEVELYTPEELEARQIAEVSKIRKKGSSDPSPESATTIFHLKMDENHLDELAEGAAAIKSTVKEQIPVSKLIDREKKKSPKKSPKKPPKKSSNKATMTAGALREFDSEVTSHKLNLAGKKKKKKLITNKKK